MEPKSPTGYDKLKEEKPPKSPKSPKSPMRPFRLRFHRMLSTGSLKSGSSSNPGTPSPGTKTADGKFYSFDTESMDVFEKQKCSKSKYGATLKPLSKKKKAKVHRENKKKSKASKKRKGSLGHISDECLNEMLPLIKITDTDWYDLKITKDLIQKLCKSNQISVVYNKDCFNGYF